MKCIACNSEWTISDQWQTKDITSHVELTIDFCSHCGLGKTNLNAATDVIITNEIQYNNLVNRIQIYFNNLSNHITIRYTHSLNFIQQFNKNKRLLEVGSNIGYTLNIAKSKGFDTFGCEINKNCKSFSELVFESKIYDDFYDIDSKFDIIIMNDVLEHFPDPDLAIKKAHELLNEDGIIFIQLPNIASKQATIKKGEWKYLLAPDHTFHFNISSLRFLMEKFEFDLIWDRSVSAIEDIWPFKYFGSKFLKLINNNPFYYPKLYKTNKGELIQAIFKKRDNEI